VTAVLISWSQTRITKGADKVHKVQLKTGEPVGAMYSWSVIPVTGTTTNLLMVTENTATIVWDGEPGMYTLSVQVTDGNGCISETISQNVEILEAGSTVFTAALPGTVVCSDLAGSQNGSASETGLSFFRIIYNGDANLTSAGISVKNPEGIFVDLDGSIVPDQTNPAVNITNTAGNKEMEFAVADSWENNSTEKVEFEIVLHRILTSDNSELTVNIVADTKRTITVLPKPVVEFE
jgi:hypothetical protein